jgi:hypothetical protein
MMAAASSTDSPVTCLRTTASRMRAGTRPHQALARRRTRRNRRLPPRPPTDPVAVQFALEAKCYAPGHGVGVGVRETSRLISRLRHRQFGVLATTPPRRPRLTEIREDGHPVIILAGRDITDILKAQDPSNPAQLQQYLHEKHPPR